MLLIDTSIWVELFRQNKDRVSQQEFARALTDVIGNRCYFLSRFTQTELLQGAKDEPEWIKLYDYLKN